MYCPAHASATNGDMLSPGITCFGVRRDSPARLGTDNANRYIGLIVGGRNSARRTHHGDLRCPFSNTSAKIAGTNSRRWSAATANRSFARNAAAISWPSGSRCRPQPRYAAVPGQAPLRPCPQWAAAGRPVSRACAAAADRRALVTFDFSSAHRPTPACRGCLSRSDSSNFTGSDDYTPTAVRNGRTAGQPVWNWTGFRTMLLFAIVAPCCASFREPDSSLTRRLSLTPLEYRSRLRPMDKNRNRG